MAITWVPKGILASIRKHCGRFLLDRSKDEVVFPWVVLEKIAFSNSWGGLCLKDLPNFLQNIIWTTSTGDFSQESVF